MSIEFNPQGPLSKATLYQINEAVFWDKTRPPNIDPQDDDEDYYIKIEDRIDLLAFDKLGNEARGWIILLRNNMRLWPNDFVPGVKIKIPTLDSLRKRGII